MKLQISKWKGVMPRVVCVYFPTWPTDRIRRAAGESISVETPIVVVGRTGSKRIVVACDAAATKAGLRVGMPVSKAQALISGLVMHDADPSGDAATLKRIAMWALQIYSPVVAVDPPDGIVIDTTGADHLHHGEELMLSSLVNRLRGRGINARAALADSWGAAYALSRTMRQEALVGPAGDIPRSIRPLPLSALRLPSVIVGDLRVLGFKTIGQLSDTPRAPLALRFGPEIGKRLDQAFGRVAEPIEPLHTPDLSQVKKSFADPISAAETIAKYVRRLVGQLCDKLEERGLGARRLDLLVHRVDNTFQAIRAGLGKPVRDDRQLARLLCDRIDRIDPGYGIERLSLVASFTEPLADRQISSSLIEELVVDVSPLLDVLGNRGGQRLYRLTPVSSDVPERSAQRIHPTAPETGADWAPNWPRPIRLLDRPEAIEAIALLPDRPPRSIIWRGKRMLIVRADGPERVFGEWWKRDAELSAVRDYFAIETDDGIRLWVYRAGDGVDTDTGSQRWFLHGVFQQ